MSIYLVGVGPGDPEYITVKAVRLIKEADIIYVPESDAGGRSVAEHIIHPYVDKEKLRMSYFPMTNDRTVVDARYTALAEEMAALSAEGKKLVYVTLGDCTIYSTALYVASRLEKLGAEYSFVPGIPSFIACSSLAKESLVERKESFVVLPLPETAQEVERVVNLADTVIFMKLSKRLPALLEYVNECQPRYATLVQRVTLDGEKMVDLLAEKNISPDAGYLSIAVVKRR